MASMRDALALAQDPRVPSSLGPVNWNRWGTLAGLQARAGDMAAAEKSLRSYVHARDELIATFPAGDSRRAILASADQVIRSRLQYFHGDHAASLANATAAADAIGRVAVPEKNRGAVVLRDNLLRAALRTAAFSALQLGHGAQAESLARRWQAVNVDQNSNADPRDESSRAVAAIAHALIMQSKAADAQAALQPALDYYQAEQKRGAQETSFRTGYAYALYVSALATNDAVAKRRALDAAAQLLDGASEEVKNLSDVRDLVGRIASAR
jgi:hypothetical protein